MPKQDRGNFHRKLFDLIRIQIKLNYETEEKRDIEKDISNKKLKVQLLI